jgi:hypothetical protein
VLFEKTALTGVFGSVISTSKPLLDVHAGFDLPWEATIFLPVLFDEYIKNSMPGLAALLRISQCSHDVVVDGDQVHCRQDLAHDCFQHARRENGGKAVQVMGTCYRDFGIDAAQALNHHTRCHGRDNLEYTEAAACLRAGTRLEADSKMCLRVPPVVRCTVMYATWDIIVPMMHKMGVRLETRGASDVCWTKLDLDSWTVSKTSTGRIDGIIKHETSA